MKENKQREKQIPNIGKCNCKDEEKKKQSIISYISIKLEGEKNKKKAVCLALRSLQSQGRDKQLAASNVRCLTNNEPCKVLQENEGFCGWHIFRFFFKSTNNN